MLDALFQTMGVATIGMIIIIAILVVFSDDINKWGDKDERKDS